MLPARTADPAALLSAAGAATALQPVRLVDVQLDGRLLVVDAQAGLHSCDCLASMSGVAPALAPGDVLLMAAFAGSEAPVVLGRVGRYAAPQPQATLTLEATETLSLKCGQASVDLRADGQVMVRGEDVLLRAKGTQRIRAGNVAIN